MKQIISLVLCAGFSVNAYSQTADAAITEKLKEGDIVFQKIPCGNLCDAIIETTPCLPGRAFNHCGIVHKAKGNTYVIEAIGKAVKQTPVNDFLKRDTAALYAGRLTPQYSYIIAPAIMKAITYIGTPYDNVFMPGDSALYCSELVWECYKDNRQAPVFNLKPMTFISPHTNATYPAWADYYKSLNTTIPEGVAGINPCAIANSSVIEIFSIPRYKQ